MASIPLMLASPQSCSYLDGRESQSVFVSPDYPITTADYSQLVNHGFRRSGDYVYRPHCSDCQQCVPVRLPVHNFQANRSQKRCLQKNAATHAQVKPAHFNETHFELYLRYQQQRHPDGQMAHISAEDYMGFLASDWCDTRFVEFSIDGQLAAVAVVDYLTTGLSAVYTFFEPDLAAYSLGVYAVLWQQQQAKALGLDYVYLGFWIEQCQKMAYKIQYQPLEGLIEQRWRRL